MNGFTIGFATGLLHLELTNGKNYLLPCDIEWGHEGKYIIFPNRYYKVIADDLFTIEYIQILDDNKILCRLENAIRPENGQEIYDVEIQLDNQNHNKIIKSGIADNTVDLSISNEENLPEAVIDFEHKEEIQFKQSEVTTDVTKENEQNIDLEQNTSEQNKPKRKAKWYKFWRYFW